MLRRGTALFLRPALGLAVLRNARPDLLVTARPAAGVVQQLRGKHQNFPSRPKPPPDTEIEEFFLKGSGPGGQKINKTNSAVQLRHIPTGIVVKSQATRSRSQNRTIARQLLADKLDDLAKGDQSRAAVVGAAKAKKRASSAKKSRRKYRKLEDEKARLWAEDEDELGSDEDQLEKTTSQETNDDREPEHRDQTIGDAVGGQRGGQMPSAPSEEQR